MKPFHRNRNTLLFDNLTHEQAKELVFKSSVVLVATRPEWEGYHYIDPETGYVILTKDDELIVHPEEIYDTDKNDWQVYLLLTQDVFHLSRKLGEVQNA